jgi:hypothetical protein
LFAHRRGTSHLAALYDRAKIAAAVRHSTLKALVIEALERIVEETETQEPRGKK